MRIICELTINLLLLTLLSLIFSCTTVETTKSIDSNVNPNLQADLKKSQFSLLEDKSFSILKIFSPSFLFIFSDATNGPNLKAIATYNSVFQAAPKTYSDYFDKKITLPDNFRNIITLPTAVHEAFHIYTFQGTGSKTTIYFGLNEKLTLNTFPTFPSNLISDNISTDIKNNFASRYSVYIDSPMKAYTTQKSGLFGLLNEYAAYFISAKTTIDLIDSFTELIDYDDKYFYLFYQKIQSYLVGLDEFKYFVASYLDYAEQNQKVVFEKIQSEIILKQVLTKLASKTDELKIISNNKLKDLEANLNFKLNSDGIKTSTKNIVLSTFSSSIYLELDKIINEELQKPRLQKVLTKFFQ